MAYTTITGTIRDSADRLINGVLIARLNQRVKDADGAMHLPWDGKAPIVDGVFSINLTPNDLDTTTGSYYNLIAQDSDGTQMDIGRVYVPTSVSSININDLYAPVDTPPVYGDYLDSSHLSGHASQRWKDPVSTVEDLPAVGNTDGDVRQVLGDRTLHSWSQAGSAWLAIAGGGGGGGEGAVDSFNGRTGPVTLVDTDVTGALGYTPVSESGTYSNPSWVASLAASKLTGSVAVDKGGTGATDAGTARTNLGLAIGTDVQGYSARLATIAGLGVTDGNFLVANGTDWAVRTPAQVKSALSLTKSDVGLGSVENTALSTWGGSTSIVTLGTIASGTWNATAIGVSKGGTGQTALGTSKQVLRTNTAATGTEWATLAKADVGLGNVENTALSTWGGSANITTLGTIGTGTWNATAIGVSKGGTGQTALGTASQVLRTNAAGTATEWATLAKADVGLGNVENTALSTWAGSTNITTLGTIASGTWNASTIGATKGGTGQTSYAVGDLLYASSTSALSKLTVGATGTVLKGGTTPSWGLLDFTDMPSAWAKKTVKVASTIHITSLSGTLSAEGGIDGVTLSVGDRVLVKNQSSAILNGIYVVAAGTWSRAADADAAAEMAGAVVVVAQGNTNGGRVFRTTFKADQTLGTHSVNWYEIPDSSMVATLDSPALTGTPTAPTAITSIENNQIATTAYVAAKVAAGTTGSGTLSGNNTWTGNNTYYKSMTWAPGDDPSYGAGTQPAVLTLKRFQWGGSMNPSAGTRFQFGPGIGAEFSIQESYPSSSANANFHLTRNAHLTQDYDAAMTWKNYGISVPHHDFRVNDSGWAFRYKAALGADSTFLETAWSSLVTIDNTGALVATSVNGITGLGTGATQAAAGNHNHSGVYLPMSGGTLTGNLTLQSAGSVTLTLEADTDNVTETDKPTIVFKQDAGGIVATIGLVDTFVDLSNAGNHYRILFEDDDASASNFLTIGVSSKPEAIKIRASDGRIDFAASLAMNGTSFMDTSRNLSNIGTIASGAQTITVAPDAVALTITNNATGNSGRLRFERTAGTEHDWEAYVTGGDFTLAGGATGASASLTRLFNVSQTGLVSSVAGFAVGTIGSATTVIDSSRNWQGNTIPATKGGTGQTAFTVGDLLYASSTTAISKLAAGAAKTVLVGNGAGAAPSYATLDLTYLPDAWVKKSALVATTAALTATYANGASGVGATLTNSSTLAALAIDGVTLAVGDRVLVKNQGTASQNGIYQVTNAGSASVAWVLTRTSGTDTPSELAGATINIDRGTTNAGRIYSNTFASNHVIGTNSVTWYRILDESLIGVSGGVQGYHATLAAVAGGTYTGDDSITTLGTIASGTWQGGIVAGQYGGTGVNNSGKTITLGGNFATSGAFAATLTLTGATNVTLPTSGTLVNSAVTTLSSLASVGTITTGTWNATNIAMNKGGTGASLTANLGGIVHSTASALAILAPGAAGDLLTSGGAATPMWSTPKTDNTADSIAKRDSSGGLSASEFTENGETLTEKYHHLAHSRIAFVPEMAHAFGLDAKSNNQQHMTLGSSSTPLMGCYALGSCWVTGFSTGQVFRFDPNTRTLQATITVGTNPYSIVYANGYIWVTNFGSGTVSRIDPATNTVASTVTVQSGPLGMCYDPDNNNIWVCNNTTGSVSRFPATASPTVTNSTLSGAYMCVYDGSKVWLTTNSNVVYWTNPTGTPAYTMVSITDTGAQGIAFDGQYLWVACSSAGKVKVLDCITGSLIQSIDIGAGTGPRNLGFDGRNMWVGINTSGLVGKLGINYNSFGYQDGSPYYSPGCRGVFFDGIHMWACDNSSGSPYVRKYTP